MNIEKLEPQVSDYAKRHKLCEAITEQISHANQKIIWEIKVGVDEAGFARIKVLTEFPEEINKHLQTVVEKWENSFWVCANAIKEIMKEVEGLKGE